MVVENRTEKNLQLLLMPNHSATWKQTKLMIYGIGGVSLIIAAYWISIGAWMVLPFIGLEIIGLTILARLVCAKSYSKDVLTVSDEEIEVTYGKRSPEKHWHFSLKETELQIVKPHHSMSPLQLKLKDSSKCLPIGSYLNKPDIEQVIQALKNTRLKYRYYGQTKTRAINGFEI